MAVAAESRFLGLPSSSASLRVRTTLGMTNIKVGLALMRFTLCFSAME